jgi:hypothetical protein
LSAVSTGWRAHTATSSTRAITSSRWHPENPVRCTSTGRASTRASVPCSTERPSTTDADSDTGRSG